MDEGEQSRGYGSLESVNILFGVCVLVGAAINSESKVVEFQATKIFDVWLIAKKNTDIPKWCWMTF